MISFTKVKLPYGWLGNMAPFPIDHDGKTWRTSEALFQAMRFDDEAVKEEIRAQKSPMGAKMAAKKHAAKMAIEPQGEQDLDNMRAVLRLKIEQHPELAKKLKETGADTLIEDCTKRQRGSGLFWGAALKDGKWVGENMLGKLWMELRETLHDGCFNCGKKTDDLHTIEFSAGSLLGPLCPGCLAFAKRVKACREAEGPCTCGVHKSTIANGLFF